MLKKIVITIVVILIGFFSWQFLNNKEVDNKTEFSLETFLQGIASVLQIESIEETDMEWRIKTDEKVEEKTYSAKSIKADNISFQTIEEVYSLFQEEGFEKDQFNIASGTISQISGFRKDDLICTIEEEILTDEEGNPNNKNIQIKCAQISDSLEPVYSMEESLKSIFSKRYNTKSSAIYLNIEESTEDFVRGEVSVLDENIDQEEKLFLAAKIDGVWGIAYGGDGILYCSRLTELGFPEEMKKGCAWQSSIEVNNGDNFSISLLSNPTTGYQWDVVFDSDYIGLIGSEYISEEENTDLGEIIVGGSGTRKFKFTTLHSGQTDIIFSYYRSWEGEDSAQEKKVYHLNITE